jgi:AcrR family transcriptional regulator
MLNMSSVTEEPTDVAAPSAATDRTARARIRDAAIARFAEDGVDGATIRSVAAAAGVSPGLVIHHFGSKDALRVACDQHVTATIRAQKRAALGGGAGMDPLAALRAYREGPPLLRYLARTLVDGSPHVAELVDEMVADAVGYMEEAVAAGTLVPSEQPRERTAVLTIWSLGALVLHEHLERLLGADLVSGTEAMGPYVRPAAEILTRGLLREDVGAQIEAAFSDVPLSDRGHPGPDVTPSDRGHPGPDPSGPDPHAPDRGSDPPDPQEVRP